MKRTPAQNAPESQGARFPRPHENQGRPPRPQGPPPARPQGAQRLSAVTAQDRPAQGQGLRFPRRFRLGRNRNYRYVYRKGKSFASRSLVLVYLRGKDLKLGFSVSSKVGNAVTRNRVRRCMREDARLMRPQLKRGKYIFVARVAAARCAHEALAREMYALLSRAQLLKEEGEA